MSENQSFKQIQEYIDNNHVVLFMKGTAEAPQCGFSGLVVNILRALKVEFKDVDVLADPALRQGIKDFTNWPTIPQLYVNREFIGGADIVSGLYKSGELKKVLQTPA